MKSRHFKLAVAAGLAVIVGGLGYRLVTAETTLSPTAASTSKPTAGATSQASVTSPANPEAGMTDGQRVTLHQQQWGAFDKQYTAWVSGLKVDQLNLHSLLRSPLNAEWDAEQPSQHDAVAKADLIVVGTVASLRLTPYSGTPTTFVVDQTLKGQPVSTVEVTQSGGLRPTDNWAGVTIAEGENATFLLPGDRAVLLLQKSKLGYEIQSVSGWYQIVGGLVHPNSLNSWGTSVNGSTEAAFLQALRAAMQ
jgi:hypothetical protein